MTDERKSGDTGTRRGRRGGGRPSQEELEKKADRYLRSEVDKVEEEDLKGILGKADDLLKVVERAGVLRKSLGKVRLLIHMLSDYMEGRYREIPWRSVAAIVAALLYILNPMDAIPDYIPVVGFLDDAAVLALAWGLVEGDVRDYSRWKYPRASSQVRSLIQFVFPEVAAEAESRA